VILLPKDRNVQFLSYNTYRMAVSKVQEKLIIIFEFSKDQFQIE